MQCPHCRLYNPPTALRCDCGYDFESGRLKRPDATHGVQQGRVWRASSEVGAFFAAPFVATVIWYVLMLCALAVANGRLRWRTARVRHGDWCSDCGIPDSPGSHVAGRSSRISAGSAHGGNYLGDSGHGGWHCWTRGSAGVLVAGPGMDRVVAGPRCSHRSHNLGCLVVHGRKTESPFGQGSLTRPAGRALPPRSASTDSGSTRAPPTRTAQCRWGPVTRPVAPTRPTISPAVTVSPSRTSMRDRCPSIENTPRPWSMMTVLPLKKRSRAATIRPWAGAPPAFPPG